MTIRSLFDPIKDVYRTTEKVITSCNIPLLVQA